MTDLWTELKTKQQPIILYGTGNGADKIIDRLEKDGVEIAGIFSSSGFAKNRIFRGYRVCSYEELKEKFKKMTILVCFGSDRPQVIENVIKLSGENELYIPDVPVYGDNIFDIEFARKNAEKIQKVYDNLADDFSKKTFKNIIYFKLSGKFEYLTEIESEKNNIYELLKLSDSETYLDLGAFNGDTVEEFINHTLDYTHITAVEPDSKNFEKLKRNTADFKNITLLNSAIDEVTGTAEISKQHGRGITQTKNTVTVETVTVDEIANTNIPTFIKADVEGSEINAIKGAFKTVSEHTPKMRIAAYHRSEDIFEIPLKVLEISPDYKIYLRHLPCFPAWDTDYIFIK